ncbi:MAG TPA: hypothetical protein DD706_24535 [Nitrospiraceae bacterium]|nr:hypothetical protein [Nitrospiraceae bacterium]
MAVGITEIYDYLKYKGGVPSDLLIDPSYYHSHQISSLTVLLLERWKDNHKDLLNKIWKIYPEIYDFSRVAYGEHKAIRKPLIPKTEFLEILKLTSEKKQLGPKLVNLVVEEFTLGRLDLNFLGFWLMLIHEKGLSDIDTVSLTHALKNSGKIYDYRQSPFFNGRQVIRRYPSGALSEKVALILPSLLVETSELYPICSPFLIAKSLGFTGGTWDKLSSIPGFSFPEPGEETIETMVKCGVAMTVTREDLCPADRKLYQFRSVTGTVESLELAVSSIASKQLAVPAHLLLMDVRTGPGSFFPDHDKAIQLGSKIKEILEESGIPTLVETTEMLQPNGSSVGNALEVDEAFKILGIKSPILWNNQGLEEQKKIVIKFYAQLMSYLYPNKSLEKWQKFGQWLFDSGKVRKGLKSLLEAHGVQDEVISKILDGKFIEILGINPTGFEILSSKEGIYKDLDQRTLGNIVNFDLGGGGNDYGGVFDPKTGIVLNCRLGDQVKKNDVLCRILSNNPTQVKIVWPDIKEKLFSCFTIEEVIE